MQESHPNTIRYEHVTLNYRLKIKTFMKSYPTWQAVAVGVGFPNLTMIIYMLNN